MNSHAFTKAEIHWGGLSLFGLLKSDLVRPTSRQSVVPVCAACGGHSGPRSGSRACFRLLFFVNGSQYVITWAELSVWLPLPAPHPLHTLIQQHRLPRAHTHAYTPPHPPCLVSPRWKCTAAAVYPVGTRKTSCTVLRVKPSPHIINTSPPHSLMLQFGWFLWL